MRLPVLAMLLALAAPAAAFAQAAGPADPRGISRDQFIERQKQRAAERAAAIFNEIDTNHDGFIDREEMRAWRASRRARSGGGATPGAEPLEPLR